MPPARKAAQAATSAFRYQDLSSDDEEHGGDNIWNQTEALKGKPQVTRTYGGMKNRGRANTSSSIQLAPSTPARGRKSMNSDGSSPVRSTNRKRKSPPSPTRSPSLSSTIYSPEPEPKSLRREFSTSALRTSQNASPLTKSMVGSILDDFVPKRPSLLAPPSSQETTLSTVATLPTTPEHWTVEDLGTFVWVRIDRSGVVFDGDAIETFWWPAKVSTSKGIIPLEVAFFGGISDHSPHTAWIASPSALNILPMMSSNGGVRFSSLNYKQLGSLVGVESRIFPSPRKKTKFETDDIEIRWGKAADDMVDAEANVNGGLSTRLSTFSGRPTARNNNGGERTKSHGEAQVIDLSSDVDGLDPPELKGRRGRRKSQVATKPIAFLSDSEVDDVDDYDLEADMLKIPGELVFCLESKSKTTYWPATVLEHVIPEKRSRKARSKYRVVFLDNKTKLVERSMFYASYQEEFCSCKLGQFQSEQVLDVHDNDDSDLDMDGDQRSLSPVPTSPPHSNVPFYKLGLYHQFSYVKPVLVAILNEKYPPAADRHRKFMQGGPARAMLDRDAGKRGRMREKEVSQLTKILVRWALRENAKARLITNGEHSTIEPIAPGNDSTAIVEPMNCDEPQILTPASDPSEPPPSLITPSEEGDHQMEETAVRESVNGSAPVEPSTPHLSRQRGCAAYERLSDHEKLDYCTNILVPEAVLQILLWRNGTRSTAQVLTDQEEEDLHKTGVELSLQSDWVNSVMQMRVNLSSGKQAKIKPVPKKIVGGTNSRPKFK